MVATSQAEDYAYTDQWKPGTDGGEREQRPAYQAVPGGGADKETENDQHASLDRAVGAEIVSEKGLHQDEGAEGKEPNAQAPYPDAVPRHDRLFSHERASFGELTVRMDTSGQQRIGKPSVAR